jgi:hypothetical protein
MNNKIEIPREVFENIFFANGGTKKEVAKELAGNYQAPLTKDRLHLANAEVEKNEYVFDSKGIRKFGGNTHEKGGTPVKLEEGARILSDHLKIGADLAKQLTKSLKLPFRATDTYAKALDRFNNASDLPKLNKEIEDLILKMDSQKSKDKTTFALNNQFLNNTLNSKNKQKQPLEKEMAGFFDMLFQEQESSKKAESGYKMQLGGSYMELAAKHGIDPERAKEILKSLPKYQDAGFKNPFSELAKQLNFGNSQEKPANMSDAEFYQKQTQSRVLGETTGKARKYTDKEKELIKKHYSKFVLDKKSLNKLSEAIDKDELVFNPGMLETLGTGKVLPIQLQHKDSPKGTYGSQDEARINGYLYNDTFKQKTGRDFDPNNPEDTKLIYNEVIPALKEKGIEYKGAPFRGQKVDAYGNIVASEPGFVVSREAKKSGDIDLDAFRRQSPGGKQMIADEYGVTVDELEESAKNPTNKFLKLTGKAPEVTPQPASEPTGEVRMAQKPFKFKPAEDKKEVVTEEAKRRRGLLLLPDQTPLLPNLLPSLKVQRRFSRIGYNDISPEQQLTEMNRSEVATQEALKDMSPQQRAAAAVALTANANMMSNKVIADVNRTNAAARNAVDVYNAKVSDAEENASAQDALDYERRTHTTLGNYDKELQGYYDKLQSNNMNNWKTVEAFNRYNALNPDVQFTGEGYEVNRNPALTSNEQNYLSSLYEADKKARKNTKKPSAKFGGRFKK